MSASRSEQIETRTPSRRCLSCRAVAPKAELIRIVRRPNGELVVDSRRDGRGAYLHRDPDCITAASSGPKLLARALRGSVTESTLTAIADLAHIR